MKAVENSNFENENKGETGIKPYQKQKTEKAEPRREIQIVQKKSPKKKTKILAINRDQIELAPSAVLPSLQQPYLKSSEPLIWAFRALTFLCVAKKYFGFKFLKSKHIFEFCA